MTGVFDFKFEAFPSAGAQHGGVGGDFGDLDIAGFGGGHKISNVIIQLLTGFWV